MKIFDLIRTNLRKVLIALAPIAAVVLACTIFSRFNNLFEPRTFDLGPTPTLRPGWLPYKEIDFQIHLPSTYDVVTEIDSVLSLSEKYANTELDGLLRFHASKSSGVDGMHSVELEIFSESGTGNSRDSASRVGQQAIEQAGSGFEVVDHGVFEADGDAYFVFLSYSPPDQGDALAVIQYIFQHEGQYWSLVIVCNPETMELERGEYDQIAISFRPTNE